LEILFLLEELSEELEAVYFGVVRSAVGKEGLTPFVVELYLPFFVYVKLDEI